MTSSRARLARAGQMKIFQGLAAGVCLEKLCSKNQMSVTEQNLTMYELFHGCPTKNIVGQYELLVAGEGIYAGLYEPGPDGTKIVRSRFLNDPGLVCTPGINFTLDSLGRANQSSPGI